MIPEWLIYGTVFGIILYFAILVMIEPPNAPPGGDRGR